jgi:pSer/pThr/pTyr-binding forkhead associated (FHA) protein
MLRTIKDAQIIELDQGAGVLGVLEIWHRLEAQRKNQGISFFTSRPWQHPLQSDDQAPATGKAAPTRATHLLYRSVAYPITDKPLTIGSAHDSGQNGVTIIVEAAGVSPKHCTVALHGGETVLNNVSDQGTFVDEKRVNGSITLKLGQIIRVGSPGEQLQLIACLTSP